MTQILELSIRDFKVMIRILKDLEEKMNMYEQTGNVSKDANYKKGSNGNAVSKKKKKYQK